MNNEVKVVLTISGIPGRVRHFVGKAKEKAVLLFKNKKGEVKEANFYYKIPRYEYVPISKRINLSTSFYLWATSDECPDWYSYGMKRKDLARKWSKMDPEERLQIHLSRIAVTNGGTDFSYNILED